MRFHRALGPGMASPVTSRVSYMVGVFGCEDLNSHDLGPQKVAEEGKSPYSRELLVKY